MVIFLRCQAAMHILKVNSAEIAGDRPNYLRMKFSALNVDFNSKFRSHKFKEFSVRGRLIWVPRLKRVNIIARCTLIRGWQHLCCRASHEQ